ncbi:hypothetical protein [Desulfonatronum parangueonense]
MIEVVRVTVAPRKELVVVVNAGLEGLCRLMNYPEDVSKRLQLATEEVFLYVVNTIRTTKMNADITARFRHHARSFQIVIEYPGIRGPLDHYLRLGHLHLLQVKTFEALGLCLASQILDSLNARYWPQEGINSYVLSLNAPNPD